MMGFGLGFGFIGILLMLLFWGGLIVLAVIAVRALFNSNSRGNFPRLSGRSTARDILDQRYARGEISRAEYEQMLQDIR